MNNRLIPADGRRVLLEALVLCLFAMAVGLSFNFRVVMDAFSGNLRAVPQVIAEHDADPAVSTDFPVPVVLEDLDHLLAAGALLVDARNQQAYRAGHLAGARSLPYAGERTDLAKFRDEVAVDRSLILYCSGYGCPDSFDLGLLLIDAGYTDVMVYEGGFPEWQDAGKPVVEGMP